MLSHRVRDKLAAGHTVLGSWITFRDPAVAEIMANAGFDWLTVDMEHSPITLSEAQELIRVISLCGVCSLVRLSANDATLAKRVMDAGADGVIVPMVNSAAEARSAVASVKYPPEGGRSVGLARAQGYGPGFESYVATANAESLVLIQIEHIDAVSNLDAILSVPGIDGLMVGPYDLSASMGLAGQLGHPKVVQALDRVLEGARSHGVTAGIHAVSSDPAELLDKAGKGFRLLAYSVDFLLLGDTCRRNLSTLRAVFDHPGRHESTNI